MKGFIIESPYKNFPSLSKSIMGWGNGYVAVPPTHVLWGKDYEEVNKHIVIHYGLTFSDIIDNGSTIFLQYAPEGWWVFGFDTGHFGDGLDRWPKEAVAAETKKLLAQIFELEMGELF